MNESQDTPKDILATSRLDTVNHETVDLKTINLENLDLENPLWHFSLKIWQNTDLQTMLLSLQDKEQCKVNHILLAMWASTENIDLTPVMATPSESLSNWYNKIVKPLRTIRKTLPKKGPTAELRKNIQAQELLAEQIEQGLLYQHLYQHVNQHIQDHKKSAKGDMLDTLLNNLLLSGVPKSQLLLLTQTFASNETVTLPIDTDFSERIRLLISKS